MSSRYFPAENGEYPYNQQHRSLIIAEFTFFLRAIKCDCEEHSADSLEQELKHAVTYNLSTCHVTEMIVLSCLHIDLII